MSRVKPIRAFFPAVAAVFFTLVFWGGVASLRGPRRAVVFPAPEPTRLRFLPVTAGSAAAESRKLWSPVLFSRPTETGVNSGEEALALVRPPLQTPLPEAVFLRHSEALQDLFAYESDPADFFRLPDRLTQRVGSVGPVFPEDSLRPPRWQAEFLGGWTPDSFTAMPWPSETAPELSWEATAFLAFNEKGEPNRVLVIASTAPEIKASLARTLWAWRLAREARVRKGRVRIRHEPGERETDG